jgi:hypothetical protein
VLNDLLKRDSLARGEDWTRDIAPVCWRPNPQLVRSADGAWERAERNRIKDLYGIEIG